MLAVAGPGRRGCGIRTGGWGGAPSVPGCARGREGEVQRNCHTKARVRASQAT